MDLIVKQRIVRGTQLHDLAARTARVLPGRRPFERSEGAGNAGRTMHPQPRMQMKEHASIVTTVTSGSPGIPRAMVLTAYFVLSPATGLFCHRHRADTSAQLDTSVGVSGPHDFAVRLELRSSARRQSVHRIPHPTFVT